MKHKKKLFFGLIVSCLFLSACFFTDSRTAFASNTVPENVADAESGIVHLILSCTTPSGEVYYLREGTGFVAGFDNDAPYILTTGMVVSATEEELSQIRKWSGLSNDTALTTQISILTDLDILIPLSAVSVGGDIPYALLTSEQKLSDSSALVFEFSANVTRKQPVYLYGYDAESSLLGMTTLPDSAPEYRFGNITEATTSPFKISCDIDAESGCSGAPLLDEHGYVIGMFYQRNDTLDIMPSDTLMELLNTLNVTYSTSSSANGYNVVNDTVKNQLASLLSECQRDVIENADSYSKKTLSNYKTSIADAMEVAANENATKDDYENAIDALTSAKEKLKPYNFTLRLIQFILLLILILLGAVNLKQYLKERKFLALLHPKNSSIRTAVFIRSNTHEIIYLSSSGLRLGCDEKKVDYQIGGNPAISRYHAAIVFREGEFYLMDNSSTNHTSINHSVLVPNRPYKLNDNDFILLADEPFVFRYINSEASN